MSVSDSEAATEGITKLSESLRMQPSFVIRYCNAIQAKVGRAKFLSDGKYKRYKELFLGAVVAQAINELSGVDLFVESPDSDPPDFRLHELMKEEPESDKTTDVINEYEIVDYTDHSEAIEDVIDKKLARAYPSTYGFVIFFRTSKEDTIDYEGLKERYKDEERLVLVVAGVTHTKEGVKLTSERWAVIALTQGYHEKLIELRLEDNDKLPQVWEGERGKDKPIVGRDFKLEMP